MVMGSRSMSLPDSKDDKVNRRGCSVIAILLAIVLFLAIAISLGWAGRIDRGKIVDLPVIDSGS